MKSNLFLKPSVCILFTICLFACRHHQKNNVTVADSPIPPFQIMCIDSSKTINSNDIAAGKPILIMYFRPDCEHCQQETRDLIKNISLLKDTRIFLITASGYEEMKYFYSSYGLGQYDNITVGKDKGYAFYKTYKPGGVPYMAIYSRRKRLVSVYLGDQITMNNIRKSIQL